MTSKNLSSLISQIKNQNKQEKDNNCFVSTTFKTEEIIKMISDSSTKELIFDWDIYCDNDIKKINKLFKNIVEIGKPVKITLRLNKIIDFDLLGIQKYVGNNIDFNFSFDQQGYTYDEFLQLNKKLNIFLNDIYSSMTPYEKYMIIYDKVRKFKKYKVLDNDNFEISSIIKNKQQSCNFKYILDNDYIDCRGYSLLLETLLNKVGIEATAFGFDVYDGKGNILGGHARTLINLSDDKYDIDGLFISNPTWDKDDHNLKYSLLPINSMRETIYGNCNETSLFDFDETETTSSKISRLEKPYNKTLREVIIELVNKIDRNESENLSLLEDDVFISELERYIYEKNNIIINEKNK